MRTGMCSLVLVLAFAIPSHAQTAPAIYTSIENPFVNVGDHSWVTFYFGHGVNGEPGTTALIVQCAFHRAELITNFDVFGEQAVSDFFAVTCSQQGPTFANGVPTTTWTLNATPLVESLVMYPSGGGTPQPLNLTINNTTWTFAGFCGHGHCSGPGASGSAEIAY